MRVHPETVWDLFHQARDSGVGLEGVIKIRHTDTHVGCNESMAQWWLSKALALYKERRSLCFDVGVHHFNVVADPASHSKKDMYVSVIWSWEQGLAVFGDVQWMLPGREILPTEQSLPDGLAYQAAMRRLARVATFRQLQACSNTLSECTRRRVDLDGFLLPEGVHIRAVAPGEVRIVHPEGCQYVAYLYKPETREAVRMLPLEYKHANLLVLGLDQGSSGTAGQAFAESEMQALMHAKWDKFHRSFGIPS